METGEFLVLADEGNHVRYRKDGGFEVPRGGDRPLPRHFVAVFPDDQGAPELHLRIEMRDGQPQCRELFLAALPNGQEVRPTDLRSINLEDLIEVACQLVAHHVTDVFGDAIVTEHSRNATDLDTVRRQVRKARRDTRRQLPDSKLPEVAEVYRNNPTAPTAAVEQAFGLNSRRTASLYVKRARDAGLLEEKD